MEVKCTYSKLYLIENLIDNPRNDNKHTKKHAEMLAKIMSTRGIRHPIIVSKRSGFIVAGHLRKLAAIELGLKEYPVDLQDFENEAEEYAFLSSDNNIARYAEFDEAKFKENLSELDFKLEDVDFEEFGIDGFTLEIADHDFDSGNDEDGQDDSGSEFILEAKFPNQIERDNVMSDLQRQGYIVKATNGKRPTATE